MKFSRILGLLFILVLVGLTLEIAYYRWFLGRIPTQVPALLVIATLLANGALAAFYLRPKAKQGLKTKKGKS